MNSSVLTQSQTVLKTEFNVCLKMNDFPPEILCLIQEYLKDCALALVCKSLNDVVKWYHLKYFLSPQFEKSLRYLCDPIPPLSPLLHRLYDNAIIHWQTQLCCLEEFFIVLRLLRIACVRRKIIRWALHILGDRSTIPNLFHHIIHFDYGYLPMLSDKKRILIVALATKIDNSYAKGGITLSIGLSQLRIETIIRQNKFRSFKWMENWLTLASTEMNLMNIQTRFNIFLSNEQKWKLNQVPTLWTMSIEQIESYFYRYPDINESYLYLPRTPDIGRKMKIITAQSMTKIPPKLLRSSEKQLTHNFISCPRLPTIYQCYLENDVFDLIFSVSTQYTKYELLNSHCRKEHECTQLFIKLLNQISVHEIEKRYETIIKTFSLISKHMQLLLPLMTLPSFLISQLTAEIQQFVIAHPDAEINIIFDKFYNKIIAID